MVKVTIECAEAGVKDVFECDCIMGAMAWYGDAKTSKELEKIKCKVFLVGTSSSCTEAIMLKAINERITEEIKGEAEACTTQ